MDDKQKKWILVVDDKRENLTLLSAIFKKYGHKYITAESGEDSINIMNNRKDIGLILMDVKMMGINGVDAMKIIKKKYNIPIIAVTGLASASDRKNLMDQGFDDYISKPIDIQNLLIKINSCLKIEN